MTPEAIANFIADIKRRNVQYLVGYVGALKVLVDYVAENSISLPSLKFVWSTAAPLPKPLRSYFQQTLGVPVYTQYGSCEFYWIASERRDRLGLDIDWDIRHVEVLSDANVPTKLNEYGRLVISDLMNFAFPLIRYEIEDRSRLISSPNNPSSLPILDYVKGRTSQTLTLRCGRKVPGEFWTTIFDDYSDVISGFSVHQLADYSIVIRYTPNDFWSDRHGTRIRNELNSLCGSTPYQLLPSSKNHNDRGKLNFVTSEV